MTPVLLLLQFTGFLSQTLPISILFLVPFQNDKLILSRKKSILLLGSCMLLFSAGFTCISWFLSSFMKINSNNNFFISNLYMCGCLILSTLLMFWLVQTSLLQKLTVLVLLVHYSAVLFSMNNILSEFYKKNFSYNLTVQVMYRGYTVFFYLLLIFVTCPLVVVFLKNKIRLSLTYVEDNILRRGCIYLFLALLLYCVCLFSLHSFEQNYDFTDLSILLFLFGFIGTDILLYLLFFSQVHLTIQNQQLGDQLRSFDTQYRLISDSISRAQTAKHDIHHHLNMIRMLHENGSSQELTDYLDSYNALYQELENMPLCNYPALDNILRYYIDCARKERITVETSLNSIRETLTFDVVDLTVILGNLMENAIESCRLLPINHKRLIRIWIKKTDSSLLLQIENTCLTSESDFPDFTDSSGFVSSKASPLHGQGLKSIQFAADKYGGSAEFKKYNGIFTSRVVLNIP